MNSPADGSVIQLAPALQRLGNDETLLREMAVFYLEDVPDLLAELQQALRSKDAETVNRSAHSIKSLSANFEARAAVDVAFQIEQQGRNEDLDTAEANYPKLVEETDRVIQALRQSILK